MKTPQNTTYPIDGKVKSNKADMFRIFLLSFYEFQEQK